MMLIETVTPGFTLFYAMSLKCQCFGPTPDPRQAHRQPQGSRTAAAEARKASSVS
jgi:hypothetical protein